MRTTDAVVVWELLWVDVHNLVCNDDGGSGVDELRWKIGYNVGNSRLNWVRQLNVMQFLI